MHGDRDLLVEIAYWHDDNARLTSRPDFIDHHFIINLPAPRPQAVLNELGQIQRADGTWEPTWREVDGEWERSYPAVGDPAYAWTQPVDDTATAITATLDRRAAQVASAQERGDGRLRDVERPPRSTRVAHIANRGSVRALIGQIRRH